MSFICTVCNKPQEAGIAPVKIVLEKRTKIYPPQELPKQKQDKRRRFNPDDDDDRRGRDRGPRYGNEGNGWEIAKEADACPACAKAHAKENA